MKQLMFYSPDGTDIRVALEDGRVAIVGEEPRNLHPAFNRAAVRAGCLTTDMPSAVRMQGPDVPHEFDASSRRDMIMGKMRKALNAEEGAPGFEDAFTANGLPNIKWLSEAVGFTIERSERDELWGIVSAEDANDRADDADNETGGDDTDRGDNVE